MTIRYYGHRTFFQGRSEGVARAKEGHSHTGVWVRYVMVVLMMLVGVGEMWGQTYYAIHQSGTGYLKVSGAGVNLGNDGTFQSGNLFDKGNCIWCITSDGYLQNE